MLTVKFATSLLLLTYLLTRIVSTWFEFFIPDRMCGVPNILQVPYPFSPLDLPPPNLGAAGRERNSWDFFSEFIYVRTRKCPSTTLFFHLYSYLFLFFFLQCREITSSHCFFAFFKKSLLFVSTLQKQDLVEFHVLKLYSIRFFLLLIAFSDNNY